LEHPDSEPEEVRPGTHDKGTRKLKYSSLLEAQNYREKLGGQLATFFLLYVTKVIDLYNR